MSSCAMSIDFIIPVAAIFAELSPKEDTKIFLIGSIIAGIMNHPTVMELITSNKSGILERGVIFISP